MTNAVVLPYVQIANANTACSLRKRRGFHPSDCLHELNRGGRGRFVNLCSRCKQTYSHSLIATLRLVSATSIPPSRGLKTAFLRFTLSAFIPIDSIVITEPFLDLPSLAAYLPYSNPGRDLPKLKEMR